MSESVSESVTLQTVVSRLTYLHTWDSHLPYGYLTENLKNHQVVIKNLAFWHKTLWESFTHVQKHDQNHAESTPHDVPAELHFSFLLAPKGRPLPRGSYLVIYKITQLHNHFYKNTDHKEKPISTERQELLAGSLVATLFDTVFLN